ncbi:hypothetical protein [Streptomyces sp. NPDC049915]|uniref:hypothetical protein n=1 Tax=Streptomyces sp. NPDC049915 TaxID=3155510 RepID=UPI0034164493
MTSPTLLQTAHPSSRRAPDTCLGYPHALGEAGAEYVLLTEDLAGLLGGNNDSAPPTGDR